MRGLALGALVTLVVMLVFAVSGGRTERPLAPFTPADGSAALTATGH